MRVTLREEDRVAVQKACFEYTSAMNNLSFLLERRSAEYLDTEDFKSRFIECASRLYAQDCTGVEVAGRVTNEKVVWKFADTNREIDLPDGTQLAEEYANFKPQGGRLFIAFQDMLAEFYPGENRGEKMADRVLSRTVTFQVTDKCNLACTYCYQVNKGTRKMKLEDAKLYVDKLLSGEDGFKAYVDPELSPGIIIEFIGGEPLLEIDLIDEIVDYFKERVIELNHPWADKYCFSICSNGVLYDDTKVQRFLQKNKNCIGFSVTLDGDRELHDACRVFPEGGGSFDFAYHATTDWMSRGNYMGSKITISPENLKYLDDALMFFTNMGYDDINANCIYEAEWTEEEAGVLYKELLKYADYLLSGDNRSLAFSMFTEVLGKPKSESELENWCGGTGVMLAMDPVGDLYPCIRYMDSSLGGEREPMCIGNVHTGLATCEKHKNCVECLQNITRKSQSTDDCFYCPIAEGCSWCSAYNYQVFGTADKRVTRLCPMHKGRVLANVYYWNKYYEKYGIDKCFDLWVPKQWAVPIIGEEEYEKLVKLVRERGGFINDGEERIYHYGEED